MALKLIIDRTKWLRGDPTAPRLLQPDTGKMCCLGFFALSCGYTAADIIDRTTPESLTDMNRRWPKWVLEEHEGQAFDSDEVCALINRNDATRITGAKREKEIAAIFAKHGVEVEFVGGEP
jgi:hypothetical protein